MREVKVYRPTIDPQSGRHNGREFLDMGIFHQFSTWGEEGQTSSCAIVEFSEGNVDDIALNMIQFVTPTKLGELP